MHWTLSTAVLGILAASLSAQAQSPPRLTAEAIMARVAANQDRAEAERAHYIYVQHAKTVSRRGGSVMCEETTDYRVTPAADGSHEELLKVDGRAREKHNYVNYTTLLPDDDAPAKTSAKKKGEGSESKPGANQAKGAQTSQTGQGTAPAAPAKPDDHDDSISVSTGDDSIDRQIVENMRKSLMEDKSRDGINAQLFPLTTKQQADYDFELAGPERMNGRDVFHVVFRPKDRKDFGWRGDAYVDVAAFEPVLVTTGMSRKIPFAVRTFLGTNFPGLGFTVTYAPRTDGIWFPVTFSTEFKIEVMFFFRRTVIVDAENRDFERTHVTSRIVGGIAPVDPQ